jgi:hypothetical protein
VKKRVFTMMVCLLTGLPHLFAVSTFSGLAEMFYALRIDDGTRTIVGADDKGKDVYGTVTAPMDLTVLFDGQFDIADFVFVRTSLAALGTNVIKDSIAGVSLSGDYYGFSIDEISLSLHFPVLSTMHYLSLFVGNNFESPGTDSYLGKYFGTSPISSSLIQNRLSHNGVPLYPTPGYGLAYHVKLPIDLMASLSGIVPIDLTEGYSSFDVRAAGVYSSFSFDAFAGVNLQFNNKTIDTAQYHVGFTGFYSHTDVWGIFLQAGIKNNMKGKLPELFNVKNLYVVLEPRFAIGPIKFDVTLFSLPGETDTYIYDSLAFVNFANRPDVNGKKLGALGGGVTVYKDDLYIGPLQSKVALSIVAGLSNNLDALIYPTPEYNATNYLHLQITPYWSINMGKGDLSLLLTFDPLNRRIPPGPTGGTYISDPWSSFGFRLGYIVNF